MLFFLCTSVIVEWCELVAQQAAHTFSFSHQQLNTKSTSARILFSFKTVFQNENDLVQRNVFSSVSEITSVHTRMPKNAYRKPDHIHQ